MCISRIFEELFPFFAYPRNRSRVKKRLNCCNILNLKDFADYKKLSSKQLIHRLDDEHQRASAMDEKTSKMTLSLSVGLTIFGFTIAFLTKSEFDDVVLMVSLILVVPGLLYLLIAVFMTLDALRTHPKYGYGTKFILDKSQGGTREVEILARALARQECMNTIRHLRNEAVYQTLRNAFWLLFPWILISTVIFGWALSEEMNVAPSPPNSAVPHTKPS